MTTPGRQRSQAGLIARQEAKRRVAARAAAAREELEAREAAAQAALMEVLAIDSEAESLREQLNRAEEARQEAVTRLVGIVGRVEAVELLDLLDLPERSLRTRPGHACRTTAPSAPDVIANSMVLENISWSLGGAGKAVARHTQEASLSCSSPPERSRPASTAAAANGGPSCGPPEPAPRASAALRPHPQAENFTDLLPINLPEPAPPRR